MVAISHILDALIGGGAGSCIAFFVVAKWHKRENERFEARIREKEFAIVERIDAMDATDVAKYRIKNVIFGNSWIPFKPEIKPATPEEAAEIKAILKARGQKI